MTEDVAGQFYSNLPLNDLALSDLLGKEKLFRLVPDSWHVVITDIVGSTQAVLGGRHEDINLIATGSIVAVLNLAFRMQIAVPFFFGGDGATFIIPTALVDPVMQALTHYRETILENFKLQLRTGTIPVAEIYAAGHVIRIAKYKSSSSFSIPIVLGNGLNFAEGRIKGVDYLFSGEPAGAIQLDLSGMQCRWDKILPPQDKEEIVTLLVVAKDAGHQEKAFAIILKKMDELYGTPEKRQPISVARLRLKTTFSRLGAEMRIRLGKIRVIELVQTWLATLYGYIYFNTKKGRQYLRALVEMSDTLVIDGKINTVISGSAAQRAALQLLLDQMETDGSIHYGMHISKASIMSCYVRDLEDGHIHFVDGAEGGYTKAAAILKNKLAGHRS